MQKSELCSFLTRCSSEEQSIDGYSIETQINDCNKKFNEIPNAKLYKIYSDEGLSGSDTYLKRPELLQMLTDAKAKKFTTLIVWKADRIGRLAEEREQIIMMLHKYKINIICCSGENLMDNSPQGKFMRKTLANIDELEVGVLAMRIKGTLNTIIEDGNWKGGSIPYGFNWVREDKSKNTPGKMIPISEEHIEQIKKIFELYFYNLMGFNLIRDYMNGNNENNIVYPYHYRNGNKGKWNRDHIRGILKNPLYCAYQYNNNVYTKFEPKEDGKKHKPKEEWELHPTKFIKPIISKELFDSVQKIMQEKANKTMTITKTTWLLTGILTCGNCNSPFQGHPFHQKYKRKKDNIEVEYDSSFYRCTGTAQYGRDFCNVKQISKKSIEQIVISQTLQYISILKEFVSDEIRQDITKRIKKVKSINQNKFLTINKELEKIEKGLERAIQEWQNGEMKTLAYNLLVDDLSNKKEKLINERNEIQLTLESEVDITEELKMLSTYFDKWEKSIKTINYSDTNSIMVAKSTLIQLIDYLKWDGKKLNIQFNTPNQLSNFLCKDGSLPTGKPTQIYMKKTMIENIFTHKINNHISFMCKNKEYEIN